MAILHVARNASVLARPEPDFDKIWSTFHRIPAATRCIESGPKAVLRGRCYTTPGVAVLKRVAVGEDSISMEIIGQTRLYAGIMWLRTPP